MGCTSLKPGTGSVAGLAARVMVSPTRASPRDLMLPQRKPTSPACSSFTSVASGENTPRRSTSYSLPVLMRRTMSPSFTRPSTTRKSTTTPW